MKLNEKLLQEKIGWKPFKAQQEIIESKARDKVICAGTRFGKSVLCAYEAFKEVLHPDRRIWIVSLSYDMSRKIFNYMVDFAGRFDKRLLKGISNRPIPEFRIPERKSWVQCKSVETPTSLMGEELNLAILDEAARMNKEIWERFIMARLSTRQGRSFTISTPFGKNWFYYKWLDAKEDKGAFHFTSLDSPYFPKEEWERAKRKLPQDIFNQEYRALFLEGAATVFRNIRTCVGDCETKTAEPNIMGLDLAQTQDFTVLTIVGKYSHKVKHWDRFQKIPYPLQIQRITETAKRYQTKIIIDALNVGSVIADELRLRDLNVYDFKAIGSTARDKEKKGNKEQMILKLSSFFDERNIVIPDNPVLIDELESFAYNLSPSGNIRYSAPLGLHDDCVISLALAVWGLESKQRQIKTGIKRAIPSIKKRFQYL